MAGLFSGAAARRRKRPPGRARSPAMSQPGGQGQFGVDERGKGRLNFYRARGAKAAKSRSDAWKLASYEVAGNVSDKFGRPERTLDFRRPFRTDFDWAMNQTLRVWLISGCPCGTKLARRRKRPPGRARAPAMSQPGGQWQFGVDERGKGRLNLR